MDKWPASKLAAKNSRVMIISFEPNNYWLVLASDRKSTSKDPFFSGTKVTINGLLNDPFGSIFNWPQFFSKATFSVLDKFLDFRPFNVSR